MSGKYQRGGGRPEATYQDPSEVPSIVGTRWIAQKTIETYNLALDTRELMREIRDMLREILEQQREATRP